MIHFWCNDKHLVASKKERELLSARHPHSSSYIICIRLRSSDGQLYPLHRSIHTGQKNKHIIYIERLTTFTWKALHSLQ